MRILAVETATTWQSVAIVEDEHVVALHEQEAGGAHGSLLLPTIDRLLVQTGLRLRDLEGLACSIGPGSFTGIRVGIATCLGLRAAIGLPLALVPTLEAMAWNVTGATMPVCPVLTSRRGEVYWAIFRWAPGQQLARMLGEQVGNAMAFAQSLPEQALVFGEGWSSMEAEIRAALPATVTVTVGSEDCARPSAATVARIGMERLHRGEIAGDVVAPLYVQRTEAEIQYDRSGGLSPVARRRTRVETKVAARLARGRVRQNRRSR